jgi:hypothetical protein
MYCAFRITFFYSNAKLISGIHLEYDLVGIKNIYKTTILPVVLYGSKTWFLTLREEHRLRVFENRVLRRFFGPKRYEMSVS